MIKQAVILCAGFGTRLRPFTDNAPKPMLPILGVPMIEWNIRHFIKFGVRHFLVNLHHLPEVLTRYMGDGSRWGAQIEYNFEPVPVGTAGALKEFEKQLDDEFFVLYGDVFSQVNYTAMENRWRELGPDGLGMQRMRRADSHADADIVELDCTGRVIAVHPKPHTHTYPNSCRMAGVFILAKEILNRIPPGAYFEIGKNLLPSVIEEGGVFWGYFCDDYSKGIDTLEKKEEVEKYLTRSGIPSGEVHSVLSEGGK